MAELQSRIVPLIVEYNVFWTRYFYRLHLLREKHSQRQQLAQRAQQARALPARSKRARYQSTKMTNVSHSASVLRVRHTLCCCRWLLKRWAGATMRTMLRRRRPRTCRRLQPARGWLQPLLHQRLLLLFLQQMQALLRQHFVTRVMRRL